MVRTYRVWYLLVLVAALAPAGARLLLWQRTASASIDPVLAEAGEFLFKHDWQAKDKLSPDGDGLGPVFNATSCAACHNQPGLGGAGGLEHNVTTFTIRKAGETPRQGVVHAFGLTSAETLADVDPSFPAKSQPTLEEIVAIQGRPNHCLPFPRGVHLSQRNTPALYGVKHIDEIPERDILAGAKSQKLKWGMAPSSDESAPVGRALHLADGRVGRFGWKCQMASLSDFVQAACANELGLGNPGQSQPTPIYKVSYKDYAPAPGLDLTAEQCNQLTVFCASLSRPTQRPAKDETLEEAAVGEKLFGKIGCAECHVRKLGSVDGIYSDLLLHSMGPDLVGGGSYGEPPIPIPELPDGGPLPSEWRTPPLWGVADTSPYLHDGRAATLDEAIQMHKGQGRIASENFAALGVGEKAQVIGFLKTLRAPEQADKK